jgi:RHS repeat-associated protein
MFTGREYLAPVGIYDYRNRVYSATLGRFLQTDPIRFQAGDINIYRYVGNSPVNGTDPMGLYCQEGDASIDTDGDPNYNKYGTDGKYPDNKHNDETSAGDKYDPTSPGVNAPYESKANVGEHVKIEANGKSVDAVVFDKTDKAHAKEHTNKPEFNEAAAKALGLDVEHNNKSGPYPIYPGDKSHREVHAKIIF